MAIDIVHDLGLDEETRIDLATMPPERKAAKLQGIRAYLSCFHLNSVSVKTNFPFYYIFNFNLKVDTRGDGLSRVR